MQRLAQDLERRKRQSRHRSLELPRGVDFSSNDYLGLSTHPALRRAAIDALESGAPLGSAGSRLLRGHHPDHARLEAFAAASFGAEAALYLANGFVANLALFTTLPHRRDAVVFDEYVHASVKEGIHAGHAARFKVPHNDADAVLDAVRRARRLGAQQVWIAVESVYSMDGDVAPLADLRRIAAEEDATLIVDEAHATGIFGDGGRGLCAGLYDERLIVLHTCGKALGVSGGLLCAPQVVIDTMIDAARPFVYSTAPPPHLAAAVRRALQLLDEEPWRRTRLHALTATAATALGDRLPEPSRRRPTHILPVILGTEEAALATAAALQQAGYDVRAIRPPTVPAGTSRLRISLGVERSEAEIAGLAGALAEVVPAAAA